MTRAIMSPRQAAVLILVRNADSSDPQILLTKRAAHLSSHAGEIAFPGGMKDEGDSDLLATALRETEEEVGIGADSIAVRMRLPRCYTGLGVEVFPFVGNLIEAVPLRLQAAELESAFWLPHSFLLADPRQRTDIFYRNDKEFWAPAYHFGEHVIWGLTARLLVEFINRHGGQLQRQHRAPEVQFI